MGFVGQAIGGLAGGVSDAAGVRDPNIQNPIYLKNVNQTYDQSQQALEQQQAFIQSLQGQGGLGNQANVFNQQQALANQLQNQANGVGPNPAMAQLNQTTGNNIAAQAALMASQRGASANAGLMARQAAMQGGNIQQQAVGQAATMQAQQQIAAQQQLAQQQQAMQAVAGNQINNQASAISGYGQQAQNLYGTQVGGQSSFNNAQSTAQTATSKMRSDTGNAVIGGIASGAGSAMMFHGGMAEPAYASGGAVEPTSFVGRHLKGLPMNCGGRVNMMSGGPVGGQASVAGDSIKNDTVPAVLSPDEIVIPRHITMSPDAPARAADFVAQILARKGK